MSNYIINIITRESETEKSIKIYDGLKSSDSIWIPKKAIIKDMGNTMIIAGWFFKMNGYITDLYEKI